MTLEIFMISLNKYINSLGIGNHYTDYAPVDVLVNAMFKLNVSIISDFTCLLLILSIEIFIEPLSVNL